MNKDPQWFRTATGMELSDLSGLPEWFFNRLTYRISFGVRYILKDPCVYCMRRMPAKHRGRKGIGRDHIVPKSLGGPDSWTNRAPACHKCDALKDHQPLLVFLVRNPLA